MKIELKGIDYNSKLSEETNAFSATIYIDEKKAGIASNRGHGGATEYYAINEHGQELIKKAEDYCKKLPPETISVGGQQHQINMSLEGLIDNLVDKHLNEKELVKFRSKVEKAMDKNIVIGIPDHSFRPFAGKVPLSLLLSQPNGEKTLAGVIQKQVLPKMRENEMILNTNIPDAVLKASGLNENQYVKPVTQEQQNQQKEQKKTVNKKGRHI